MGNQSSVFLEAASTGNSTALDQILHKSGSALVSTCDEVSPTGTECFSKSSDRDQQSVHCAELRNLIVQNDI